MLNQRPFWQLLILFLIINFGALALGAWLQEPGPMSEWYQNLNKAPWTPPGWFFGVAWTTIMICFSIFMANLVKKEQVSGVWTLFAIQFVLNVSWNPMFFSFKQMGIALINIIALTILVGYFFFGFRKQMKGLAFLVLPYFVWLLVATTLNAYALMYN